MPLKMDTSKTGLEMFFKPWQVQALDHLQQIHPRGANSRGVHRAVSRKNAISRTSIIIFLDRCVDDGLMSYTEATGKGGRHRVYALAVTGRGLKDYLADEVIRFLKREFPEGTRITFRQLNGLTARN
jgi:hypothetical protein